MSTYLSSEQLDQVKDFISVELLKRGYTANIISFKEKDGGIIFHTESFQTTPVLFKNLYISNFSTGINKDPRLSEEYEVEVFSLWIQVSVRYENFTGGTNGTNLFDVRGSFVKNARRVEELMTC